MTILASEMTVRKFYAGLIVQGLVARGITINSAVAESVTCMVDELVKVLAKQ